MTLRTIVYALLLAVSALSLNAGTIVATLPEFNGPYNPAGPYPGPTLNVGTFTFVIPVGQQITSATLTGMFGNSQFSDTAGVDLTAGGLLITSCPPLALCDTGTSMVPFSFIFPAVDLSMLNGGSLVMTAKQTSANIVRLSAETLTINTQTKQSDTQGGATTEPASVALLGAGLVALGVIRRKSARS
jgi:hypothetical protein